MTLDQLYGQKVMRVVAANVDNDSHWSIEFEGGEKLVNNDGRFMTPGTRAGAVFQRAAFDSERTTLYFDDGSFIELAPTEYAVLTAEGEVTWPQRSVPVESSTPDDPSSERVADGPANNDADDDGA